MPKFFFSLRLIFSVVGFALLFQGLCCKPKAIACSQHDLGLLGFSAQPTALESGQSKGILTRYSYLNQTSSKQQQCLQGFSWGWLGLLRYGQVTENSLAWSVNQLELGSLVGLQGAWTIGRGRLSLSMTGGGQWVIETQDRLQGERLSQNSTGNTENIALQRSASLWIPEINLAPALELNLVNTDWGGIGLVSRLEFAYHFFTEELAFDVDPYTWGVQFGVSIAFGTVDKSRSIQPTELLESSSKEIGR